MRTTLAICVVAVGMFLSAGPAVAHHAFTAEFDAKKPLKLTGTVTKFEWTNPHAWFYIDVKDDSGTVTNWGFEMNSPNMLLRNGWTRNSLKIGDLITAEGFGARDGSHIGNAKSVTMTSTGQQLLAAPNQGQ
ncbi:MAG TPA: DUF6152 family protein [Rugosimonospora sp.]|nr:DUF6152 family protein [Rugosimonospora sp.]